MVSINRITGICLLLVAIVGTTMPSYAQATGDGNVVNSSADESVAIRFYLQLSGDYFKVPLVFRVVDRKDHRFNTAPVLDSGRTAYITLAEMQKLLPALVQSGLSWLQGQIVEIFGSSIVIPRTETMQVTILSSHGTALAALDPKKICKTLSPLDSDLTTPRALWEFQAFRIPYGCTVPGFNYNAYPDRE